MKISTLLILALFTQLLQPIALLSQKSGLISHAVMPSWKENDTIRFGLMLPPSYGDDDQNFPVVFYLHGLHGHYADWKSQQVAEFFKTHSAGGDFPECILVFPDGKEGFWCDHFDGDPLIETELIENLIPYIDRNYNTDRNRRLIMGWSAGGLAVNLFYSKHPELFKGAINLDGPSFNWDDFILLQGERPDIIGNRDHYSRYIYPVDWVARNREMLKEKPDTAIILFAGHLSMQYERFPLMLKDQEIPFIYRKLNCDHDFKCVFPAASDDLVSFISRSLR
jgi:pimeloyl-ACP methyl ester carboxylesterase